VVHGADGVRTALVEHVRGAQRPAAAVVVH
jgi:hypothetical protein